MNSTAVQTLPTITPGEILSGRLKELRSQFIPEHRIQIISRINQLCKEDPSLKSQLPEHVSFIGNLVKIELPKAELGSGILSECVQFLAHSGDSGVREAYDIFCAFNAEKSVYVAKSPGLTLVARLVLDSFAKERDRLDRLLLSDEPREQHDAIQLLAAATPRHKFIESSVRLALNRAVTESNFNYIYIALQSINSIGASPALFKPILRAANAAEGSAAPENSNFVELISELSLRALISINPSGFDPDTLLRIALTGKLSKYQDMGSQELVDLVTFSFPLNQAIGLIGLLQNGSKESLNNPALKMLAVDDAPPLLRHVARYVLNRFGLAQYEEYKSFQELKEILLADTRTENSKFIKLINDCPWLVEDHPKEISNDLSSLNLGPECREAKIRMGVFKNLKRIFDFQSESGYSDHEISNALLSLVLDRPNDLDYFALGLWKRSFFDAKILQDKVAVEVAAFVRGPKASGVFNPDAVLFLLEMLGPRAVTLRDIIAPLLYDPIVGMKVAPIVAQFGIEGAAIAIEGLKSPDYRVRLNCIRAIAKELPDKLQNQILNCALQDPHPAIALEVCKYLRSSSNSIHIAPEIYAELGLIGRRFPTIKKVWKSFWDSYSRVDSVLKAWKSGGLGCWMSLRSEASDAIYKLNMGTWVKQTFTR